MSTESTTTKKGMTPAVISMNVTPAQTLRKRQSLKPKKSLLRIKSLRPPRPLIGKILLEEEN